MTDYSSDAIARPTKALVWDDDTLSYVVWDGVLSTGAVTIGAVTQSGSWSVSGTGTFATKETRAATPSQSSVAGSASSVTLLAANSDRLGATIYNDSTAALYVKLGATASTSSFTVKMASDGYFEVPYGYTGVIDGIWASATGNARITEVSA